MQSDFCKDGEGKQDANIICGSLELSKTLSLCIFYPNISAYNYSMWN